jgi:hypothetical protein
MLPESQSSIPVLLFQITSRGLELLNRTWDDYPGLTPNRWLGISRGGWRSLVPEEYHPQVEKLTALPLSDTYTVVEFPVYWQDCTIWLLVFAAAVAEPDGGRKIVGLVQEAAQDRQWPSHSRRSTDRQFEPESLARRREVSAACAPPSAASPSTEEAESVEDLCHNLSGPLTSILVNCELLMEGDCPPPVRERLEGIFTEAMQMNQQLRSHRKAS